MIRTHPRSTLRELCRSIGAEAARWPLDAAQRMAEAFQQTQQQPQQQHRRQSLVSTAQPPLLHRSHLLYPSLPPSAPHPPQQTAAPAAPGGGVAPPQQPSSALMMTSSHGLAAPLLASFSTHRCTEAAGPQAVDPRRVLQQFASLPLQQQHLALLAVLQSHAASSVSAPFPRSSAAPAVIRAPACPPCGARRDASPGVLQLQRQHQPAAVDGPSSSQQRAAMADAVACVHVSRAVKRTASDMESAAEDA